MRWAAAALVGAAIGVSGSSAATVADAPALAYVQRGARTSTIVVVRAGGSQSAIASGEEPAWSPDGTRLAYSRGGSVYVANADGSGQRLLASGTKPSWAPGGARLAVGEAGVIWSVDASTGARTELARGLDPAWGPDGRLALAHDGDLAVLDPATGRTTAVTSGAPTDGDPAWSPDGALLAFTRDGEVFQVALDGSVPRRVASGRDPAWAGGAIVLSGEGAEICLAAAHALSRITYRTTGAANLEPTVADASATAALAARPAPPGPLPPACADPPDPTIQVGGTHVPSGPKQVVSYESQLANRGGATASAWVVQEVRGHVRMLELRSSRGFCRRVETTTRVECYTGPIPPARTGTVVVRFRPLEPVPASNLALYADPGITYPSFGLFDCAIGGTEGNDVLTGTDRKEVMCGFGGEDRLFGGGGDDSLDGGAGDDRLDGGVGDDRIVDRVGANVFVGGPGRDRLEGGPANDTFYARDGRRDLVYGYAGFDRARVDPGILDSVYSVERVF